MSLSIERSGIQGILLDIEGTTTPISFVYDILFPFARTELAGYLRNNGSQPRVREILGQIKRDHAADSEAGHDPPPWGEPPLNYVHWLMERDRKLTGLKALQGLIWEDGYRSGRLRGQVFSDVVPALRRWNEGKLDVRIFSSGSALAQRLLFGNSEQGDLTPMLRGYFDTSIGAKSDPESYHRIAEAFDLTPKQILFISDVTAELDAARKAGYATLLSVRPGNRPQAAHKYHTIASFDEIHD
jgi:enolase-phosphatase E1